MDEHHELPSRNADGLGGAGLKYHFSRIIEASFDEALSRARQALQSEGFGVLTEIDVKETLKKKLGVDFRNYRVLGACNPPFAYQALQLEDKVGTMLPCNVILQERGEGKVEVSAVDPVASMQAIDNPALREVAEQVGVKLLKVIESL